MTKIIQRHDTAANWSTINPVLALGEMGVETDTNKFKFGDGTTSYNELPYAAGEGGSGSGTILTSRSGDITYDKLALGDGLIVDTGDIPWTNPQMSSNSQDGYVASASISSSGSGAAIYKAFDKDTTTSENAYYTGAVSLPQWIMLECPEPVRLTSCMIMNEIATPVNLRSGYIQGSNDGSNFDTLYTIIDRPNTTGLRVTYTFDNNKYYKYLRVYCVDKWSGSNGISFQEIEFSGFVKDETAVPELNVNVENSIKLSVTETLDTTHFEFENGTVNEIDNTFRCSGNNRIIIKPNIATANLIILKARWRFETNTTSVKTIIRDISGTHNTTLPCVDCYSSYDLWFPNKQTIGSFPGDSWRNLTLTINKVNGSLTFYQEDDNGNITDNWSGYSTGTGRDTSIRWGIMQGKGVSAIIVDTHSLVLIEDGVEYPYYQGDEYTIKHIVIGSGLQASIDSKNNTSAISGQDVKTFTGYSDTGTLVLKSINGVLQWVAEA